MRHILYSPIFVGDRCDLIVVGTEGDESQTHEDVLKIHGDKLAKMGMDTFVGCKTDTSQETDDLGEQMQPIPVEQVNDVPEPEPVTGQPIGTAPVSIPVTAQPIPEDETCRRCGAPVTKSQGKISRFFTFETLCKPCMDKMQKGSQ